MANTFSSTWYATFLDAIPPGDTSTEIAFLMRHLPLDAHPSVLDVCCGPGRHALPLARAGYRVHGLDTNASAIARAASGAPPGASFEVGDMRNLRALGRTFDAGLSLWQSFGYFDDPTNAAALRAMYDVLRPGGRAVIDVYNRDHYRTLPSSERSVRNGREVETTRTWTGHRLHVTLSYGNGGDDVFDWRLYTPGEFAALAGEAEFRVLRQCAWFDDSLRPSCEHARMQFVLERT